MSQLIKIKVVIVLLMNMILYLVGNDVGGPMIAARCTCLGACSLSITGPYDVAVSTGDTDVVLECTDSDPVHIAFWQKIYSQSDIVQLYYYAYTSGVGTPTVSPGYLIDTENYHNIVFPDGVTHEKAGTYRCTVLGVGGMNYVKAAALVVLDDMACTTGDGIVASRQHGEAVELVCSLELSGTLLPQLQWKHGNVVLNADHTSTEGENSMTRMTSTVNITIDSSTMDHETFTCHVSFPNPSAVDQRAPSYHDSCSVDMSVVHRVTGVFTSPSNDDVEGGGPISLSVGDVILCTASASPAASFKWVKQKGSGPDSLDGDGIKENESQLSVTTEMIGGVTTYECQASNTVPGEDTPSVSRRQVTFTVDASGPPDPNGGNQDNGNDTPKYDELNSAISLTASLLLGFISLLLCLM